MSDEKTITRLVETKGTRRVYEVSDGAIETREGGSPFLGATTTQAT